MRVAHHLAQLARMIERFFFQLLQHLRCTILFAYLLFVNLLKPTMVNLNLVR